jgi:signal transduction histidine kinase/CheY-like chemotaxis protein
MHSSLIYESVFNCGATGNCLFSPTYEAIILDVNDAFLGSSSRSRESLVGISVFDAFPSDPDDLEDTGEAALRVSIRRAIETGKAQTMPVQRYPISVVLPNGETGYEERYWSAVNAPVFDRNGKLLCISHTTTDITEKIHADTALRESEGRLRALITATADVVYRMNPDWTQMHRLEGRGFLKDTDGTRRYVLDDYVPAEDQEAVQEAIGRAIRSKTIFALEHRVRRADGSYGWTYSRAVPMLDADGEIYEWIGAASDITDRRRAEEKLRETDRRKDEFLAMLAHELRNPLAPISSAAELLQMPKLDTMRVQQTSEIIARQVKHLTSLVNDLLDVSRVTRGLVELDNTALDIRQIVADAVEQSTPLIQARRHHLALHLAPDTTIVVGDKKRLVQVIANLVNNAAKYTHEGGNILVRTEVRDAHVLLEVADNGIGMEAKLVGRAFDLFAQAEVTSDRSSGGLGLGLALVKSLVELHGGTVQCESAGIGKGSKFTICLPRLMEAFVPGPQQSARPWQNISESLRLLVVDDNVDAAAMLTMLLQAAGYEVFVEHSPKRALERARIERPDVCLLDIGLPEMDGNELAQRLRAYPETADSVLIAITGYGQENDRRHSAAAGFDHHLIKPVDTNQLISLLGKIERH